MAMAALNAQKIAEDFMLYPAKSPDFWGRMPEAHQSILEQTKALAIDVSCYVMGKEDDPSATTVILLNMSPGSCIVRHAHPCERLEVIVSGSLIVGDKTLTAGDVMTAEPNEAYGPHYAGAEGCVTMEVFSSQSGIYPLVD